MSDDSLVVGTFAGAVSAIPFLGPFIAPAALRVGEQVHKELERNFSTSMRAAEHASGMKREDLAEAIEATPELVPLYIRFLHAAAQNGSNKVLVALGTTFGRAAAAAARGDIDQVEGIAAALKAIDGMSSTHFVVLERLTIPMVGPDRNDKNELNYFPEHIATSCAISDDLAAMCLVSLAAAGFATTLGLLDGIGYSATALGRAALQAIETVSKEL